jgi:hypothetical protein
MQFRLILRSIANAMRLEGWGGLDPSRRAFGAPQDEADRLSRN